MNLVSPLILYVEVIFLSRLIKTNKVTIITIDGAAALASIEKELQNKLKAAKKLYSRMLEQKLYDFNYYKIKEQTCKDPKVKPMSLCNHKYKLEKMNFIFKNTIVPGNFIFFSSPETIPRNILILNWCYPANYSSTA